MILHFASTAVHFADQLAQAPVQIQCMQEAAPESWLKLWLPTIVQTVVSLASITTGVWIALWSFHMTGKRDHFRWMLDQKKAEWREILIAINACRDSLPLTALLQVQQIAESSVAREAYEKVLKAQQTIFDRLFIDALAIDPVVSGWENINGKAKKADLVNADDFANAYLAFVNQVRNAARKDLGAEGVPYPEVRP
jgi:hypothetical protein